MPPKPASKAKKPLVPIAEPEDKNTAPDLSAVLADLRGNDVEAQQQAAIRLFGIREYSGSKLAVSATEVVSSLVLLINSDKDEVQVACAHCLARFAAWQGLAQQAICTPENAEAIWKACLGNSRASTGAPKVLSKEFLEGCIRCMTTMCFASSAVCSRLNAADPAPLVALYQHPSAKIQERACQLTARLAVHDSPRMLDTLRGLMGLCSASVAAPVREQACHALHQIVQSTAGLSACLELLALGATPTLLQLLKGSADSARTNLKGEEYAALVLCKLVQTQPSAAVQIFEADGLQIILSLLPVPYTDTSSDSNAAAAAGSPTWSGRPQSAQLQANLLQLFAAIVQSAQVREAIIANDSTPSSTPSLPVLLNLLQPDAPQLPAAPPAAAVPAGGKRPTSGKPDSKGKAAGKGQAAPAGPVVPPPELLPPFPAVVHLAALQCLQGLAKSPELVKALLSSPLLQHLAKVLTSASDKLAREVAVLVQYMALNSSPDQLPSADLKPVMHSLAQQSLKSSDQLLQAAVGSAACSLPASLFMPDVRPPLPSPPQTPPPPPLPVSKFIWDAMDYDISPAPASAVVS